MIRSVRPAPSRGGSFLSENVFSYRAIPSAANNYLILILILYIYLFQIYTVAVKSDIPFRYGGS